ncbi:hypothetical protein GCM10010124_18800 [Pilimelia terevasa]|uniref:Uncharacterized protein n=1 Tax=Pilimelia terevasa TaxID=53372 RepID=A0A8J3BJD8_9ACTN|nr:hypothetical protein GCM10010124_18800 [Pilimelia terevasa]
MRSTDIDLDAHAGKFTQFAVSLPPTIASQGIEALRGRTLKVTAVWASDLVDTYQVRGEIAGNAGLVLHGHDEFVRGLASAEGQLLIGSLPVGALTHMLLFSEDAKILIAWMVIEGNVPRAESTS